MSLNISHLDFAEDFVRTVRSVLTYHDLSALMQEAALAMGFRYWALIHHDDLRVARPDRVNLKNYPEATTARLIDAREYRRDPVIRGCIFADGAFLWSKLSDIIHLESKDRKVLAMGAMDGLNEGITIPYNRLGECVGSCTFAGIRRPENADRFLGLTQMIGIFAFQAARRLLAVPAIPPQRQTKLLPRQRDCIVLVGQGRSNKHIARILGLTPRTVDGYLTAARSLYGAHDRAELVAQAVLAGEIGLHEFNNLRQSTHKTHGS
ncbi:helix-turn-helix transcriptional regulator [Sphingobium sp. YG1]|uniref:helix-turn-helix transcriptional regulator n=1 Tax=Sphingobium sp. YG1 TaxID=2082188 RepID=UPI000E74FA37|nr:LuxR family transcriptional regulator [Sphingobium sp. YG1]